MTAESPGRGDPARTLALLWRVPGPPGRTRGPRPGLDVDRIVHAAIEVADADGLAALSMRRVAERLGVGAMSLYTYVPGKAELLDLVLDTVCAGTARPDHSPGPWRASLARIARENLALHARHPWLSSVSTVRPTLGPHGTAKYEYELAAVDGIGLSDVEMDAVLTLVLGHVQGAARGAAQVRQVEQATGMTDAQWWEATAPLLARVFDPGRFPLATRVGTAAGAEHQAAYEPGHAFAFGLDRILDGVEVLVRSRADAPSDRPGPGGPAGAA